MDEEKITPAIPPETLQALNNQMTKKEFQDSLYYWFNEKGLVANMRSYLRMKMIEALRNTNMGKSAKEKSISMETQAINILVAEYLFQQEYDYSLSVFSTEIPIKNLVSEFCFFMFNHNSSSTRKEFKLTDENILCIFELLKISTTSKLCFDTIAKYRLNEHDSLLFCLVKNLVKINDTSSLNALEDIVDKNEDLVKYILHILRTFNIPSAILSSILVKINENVEDKIKNIKVTMEKEYKTSLTQIRDDFTEKESQLNIKMSQVEKYLAVENERLDSEQKKLLHLTESVMKNSQVLSEKKAEIELKIKELLDLENNLKKQIRHNEIYRHKLKNRKCASKHCLEVCEDNKKSIKKLELQNKDSTQLILEQKETITDLNEKISSLMDRLKVAEKELNVAKFDSHIAERDRQTFVPVSETSSEFDGHTKLTSKSSSDFTDNIVKESNKILQQLEKESVEIEMQFKKYQLRKNIRDDYSI